MLKRVFADPTHRLRVWVATIIVLGAGVVAATAHHGLGARPVLWKLAIAAIAFLAGDIPALRFRFGHDHHSFTWSETAVVMGLVLLPGPWLIVVAPLCVGAAHLAAKRPLMKVAFNAAAFAMGITWAHQVHHVLDPNGGPAVAPHAWLALAAGAFAFFLWNGLTVSVAVALSQGLHPLAVYRKGLGLNTLVFTGNTIFGITLVAMGGSNPLMLLALPFFCALLVLSYRAYLDAIEERDTWEVLQRTSRDLLTLDTGGLGPVVVERAASLFRAEFVELMLVTWPDAMRARLWRWTGEGTVVDLERPLAEAGETFWPRLASEREGFEIRADTAPAVQRQELDELGLRQWVVSPLVYQGACIGALRLGFRGKVKMQAREMQVLSTYVNHVCSSLTNARLFEEINEDRRKLHQVFSNSSDGIFAVDGWGCISSWNPAMAAITGRAAADAMGRPFEEALPSTTEQGEPLSAAGLHERLAVNGGRVDLTASTMSSESGRRWLSLAASSIRDGGASFVAVARDVTAMRAAEEAKQDFVATVSHELRTPLTPLKGFLLTLMRPEFNPSPEDRAMFYGRMLDHAHRLERLIEDLLSIAQLERGTFSIDSDVVLVDDLVDHVAQTVSRPLDVQRGGPQAVAYADAGRVEQVLHNLVTNAEKYSPDGSRIVVSTPRVDREVLIAVADEGPGIAEEDREVIFERFRRLGPHLTRASGGTGLGLYIARRLVEAMGGRIWVEANPGQGSRFCFTLPTAGATQNQVVTLN
jgi:PAS domain S-box-containing protein